MLKWPDWSAIDHGIFVACLIDRLACLFASLASTTLEIWPTDLDQNV